MTAAVALVAGGSPATAARLAAGMLGLQAAIGALNDVVDAPADAGRKAGKPIPAGILNRRSGLVIAAIAAVAGLALSALSGPPTALLALGILGVGALYDLKLKGTPLSWAPFAVGIPLLPVYGWLGATGAVASWFAILLPIAFVAGAALALSNALVDVERDRAAGATSAAAALGRPLAWQIHAVLHGLVLMATAASLAVWGRPPEVLAIALLPPGIVLALGIALARADAADRRERGWQLEAAGIAVLAGTWLVLGVPR